jgi:hypothetical protein
LHRRPNSPVVWSPCFPRTTHLPLAASPCSRLSRPPSTISQSDCRQVVRSPSPCQLVGPYKSSLNLTALPCSHGILRLHASGTNPGSISGHSPCRILGFCLPRCEMGSATSRLRSISGLSCRSLSFRPTTSLSTLRSAVVATTQDSVRGCELGFAAVPISGDWTP